MASRDDCRLEVEAGVTSSRAVIAEESTLEEDKNDEKEEEEKDEDDEDDCDELVVSVDSVTQMPPASHSISLQELKFCLPLSLSEKSPTLALEVLLLLVSSSLFLLKEDGSVFWVSVSPVRKEAESGEL